MTSINGTKVLALNSAGNALAPLKVDSNGLLRVIAEATSVSANAINLNTDGLEGLQTSTNSKLDTIDGVLDNAEAHLGNIDTGIDVLEACVGSNKVNVNISSGNITGFSTAANQSTIIGHVDGIETSLTAITGYVDGIEGNQATMIGHLDGVEGKLDTLETTLTAIETDQAAIEVLLTAANGKHAANETLLGTIDSDTDAIKTSTAACATDLAAIEVINTNAEAHLGNIDTGIDVLEACVGSNKVNVNISSGNISGFATETTLGNAEAHLGNIETAVQALDDIVKTEDTAHNSGDKGVMMMVVRQDSQSDFGADGDYVPLSVDANGLLRVSGGATDVSALSTHAKQDTIIGHLDGVEGKLDHLSDNLDTLETTLTAIETDQAAIEVLLTAANVDHAANEVLLTNAEGHLGNIDDDTGALAACVGSNKVNVNISSGNISGFSTASNQSTIIGHLDDVEGKLDTLETTLTAIETDQAAIEVLLTAANGKHAANETLLGTIDSDTDAIKTSTAACATDLAAIEVLLTAANTDHAANEVLLTGIDQKLGDIETAVQLIDDGYGTMTETTLLNASVGSSATTTSNVFTKPREITHAGISIVADTNGTYNAFIEYSVDNSTYFQGANLNFSSNAETSGEIGSSAISSGYKYYRVRVANNHSGSQNFTVKICY